MTAGPVTAKATMSATTTFGGKNSYTSTTSGTVETSSSSTETESTAATSVDTASEQTTVDCSASVTVPPLHTVPYTVTMSYAVIDYVTYSDLRYTKCSAAFENATEEDLYIYLYDIPGAAKTSTGQSCDITFGEAEYKGASMKCNQAVKMASYELGLYVPICNRQEPSQWEPCQCDFSHSLYEATCVCVNEDSGEPLENGDIAVIDTSDGSQYSHYSEWCDDRCPNSYYTGLPSDSEATSSAQAVEANVEANMECVGGTCFNTDPVNKEPADNVDWNSLNLLIYAALAIAGLVFVAVFLAIVYIWGRIFPRNSKYQAVATVDPSHVDCI